MGRLPSPFGTSCGSRPLMPDNGLMRRRTQLHFVALTPRILYSWRAVLKDSFLLRASLLQRRDDEIERHAELSRA